MKTAIALIALFLSMGSVVSADESVIHYIKGQELTYKVGKEDLALLEITDLIREDPYDTMCYGVRGKIYEGKGDFTNAIEDFSTWIDLKPNDSEAYLARGDIYLSMGRIKQAIKDFTRAAELNPEHVVVKRMLVFAKKKLRR